MTVDLTQFNLPDLSMAGENELLNTVFVYGLGYLSSWIIIPLAINHVLSYFQLNRGRGPEEKDLGKWIGIIERALIMTFLFKGYIQKGAIAGF